MVKEKIRDFGDVVDAIQAMEINHAEQVARLAQTVSDLAITTRDATNAATNDVRALTTQLTEHPLTCPIKPELQEQIKANSKELNRLSVFAGKIVGSVIGWGVAAGIAGFFLVRWLEQVFKGTGVAE